MLAAVSSSNTSLYGSQQRELEQARRRVEAADRSASSLQSQAAEAQRTADSAAREARALAARSSEAQAQAAQARAALLTLRGGQGIGRFVDVIA